MTFLFIFAIYNFGTDRGETVKETVMSLTPDLASLVERAVDKTGEARVKEVLEELLADHAAKDTATLPLHLFETHPDVMQEDFPPTGGCGTAALPGPPVVFSEKGLDV